MKCIACGLEKPVVDKNDTCPECKKALKTREKSLAKQNYNWIEFAKENEINLWERQPGETDHEYKAWMLYRDMYPAAKPTYSAVAQLLGVERGAITAIGTKWSFQARIQAWAKNCDDLLLSNKQQEIVDMNKRHVDLATKINEKLDIAIDQIDPYSMKPGELATLMKMSAEMERKARFDNTEAQRPSVNDDTNPNLKKVETKTEDIAEIAKILMSTGMISPTALGIKQTTTTEVVVKED